MIKQSIFIFLSSIIFQNACFCASIANKKLIKHSASCRDVIKNLEKTYGIPDNLLYAIAHVESKIHPWAVNAQGKSRFFQTKDQAVHFAQSLKRKNVKNIGVGCMQINLSSHGKKFKSLSDAFDPHQNIAYSAKFLKSLYDRFGSWERAVEFYHTANPLYNAPYRARVYRVWNKVEGVTNPDAVIKNRIKVGFGPGMGIKNRLD
ncbi:MAG: hypothetical protein HEEMFOPI_00850 [Holosporales bacterium]